MDYKEEFFLVAHYYIRWADQYFLLLYKFIVNGPLTLASFQMWYSSFFPFLFPFWLKILICLRHSKPDIYMYITTGAPPEIICKFPNKLHSYSFPVQRQPRISLFKTYIYIYILIFI